MPHILKASRALIFSVSKSLANSRFITTLFLRENFLAIYTPPSTTKENGYGLVRVSKRRSYDVCFKTSSSELYGDKESTETAAAREFGNGGVRRRARSTCCTKLRPAPEERPAP